jgi:hypothetical protein
MHPHLSSLSNFEVVAKMLSTTDAGKHLTVSSFRSPADVKMARTGPPGDAWWARVRGYQALAGGGPMLGRRIWPEV